MIELISLHCLGLFSGAVLVRNGFVTARSDGATATVGTGEEKRAGGNPTRNGTTVTDGVDEGAPPDELVRGGAGSYVVSGAVLKWQQFCGLILKRFYHTRRNLKGLFSQIFLPSFFITIAMVFALSVPSPNDAPPLRLNTAMFDRPNYVPFANEANSSVDRRNHKLAVEMEETLKLPSGIGSFCHVQNTSDKLTRTGYSYPCVFQKERFTKQLTKMFNKECANAVYGISNIYLCANSSTGGQDLPQHDRKAKGCHCASDKTKYVCSGDAAGSAPKELIPATMDTLRNVTGRNVSKYLLHTTAKTRMKRYAVDKVASR